jgi:hypothetical protein
MSESCEKVYCFDRPNENQNAALWATMANKDNNNMLPFAMMNGGMNNQWNNPLN